MVWWRGSGGLSRLAIQRVPELVLKVNQRVPVLRSWRSSKTRTDQLHRSSPRLRLIHRIFTQRTRAAARVSAQCKYGPLIFHVASWKRRSALGARLCVRPEGWRSDFGTLGSCCPLFGCRRRIRCCEIHTDQVAARGLYSQGTRCCELPKNLQGEHEKMSTMTGSLCFASRQRASTMKCTCAVSNGDALVARRHWARAFFQT